MARKMGERAGKIFYRNAARLRLGVASLVLALFLFAYLAQRQEWNGLLAALLSAQLSPSLIRDGIFSVTVIAVLAATLLCGRWYCSVACPLGTLQEVFWRVGMFFRRGAHRASVFQGSGKRTRNARPYIKPWRLRYLVPVLAGVGLAFGLVPLMIGLDPISIFGRNVQGVAGLLRGTSSLAPFVVVSLALFAFILLLSAWRGRRFCDWCPVGVALGFCSSVAPLGMRMDEGDCVACGACERACPMNCIDASDKKLSRERCVVCMSCASVCPTGAARYGLAPRSAADPAERRKFLADGSRLALGAMASYFGLGGGSIRLRSGNDFAERNGIVEQSTGGVGGPILPPGAGDLARYTSRCVGCQACVAACPVKIVKIKDSPHPVLDYANGYCQFSCADCTRVCPTEALRPLHDEKQRTRIALSSLRIERCVVVEKKQACGACAEVCPTHALRMQPYAEAGGLPQPIFEEEYCIGCGACRYACPVTDEPRAFEIAGVPRQTTTPGIRPADKAEDLALPGMGEAFPF